MKNIEYNKDSVTLRIEFPSSWDASSVSAVAISVVDTGGSDLLASTAATLYTATTLASAASAGDSTITVAALAGNLTEGDRLSLENPREDVVVESYNSTSKVATLRESLFHSHASGSAVSPQWATYALDTSDTDVFPLGEECVIQWVAAGIDSGTQYEFAVVKDRAYETSDFERRFRLRYPAEADQAGDQLRAIAEEATNEIKAVLKLRSLDLDLVADKALLDPLVMAYARWMVTGQGGDGSQYEREIAWQDYIRLEQMLTASPIWIDKDMDDSRADDEVDDHVLQSYERSF